MLSTTHKHFHRLPLKLHTDLTTLFSQCQKQCNLLLLVLALAWLHVQHGVDGGLLDMLAQRWHRDSNAVL